MAAFLDDPVIKENMRQLGKDYDQFLNDSDIIIIEPPICEWTCEWTPDWTPHDGTASSPGACDCPTHTTLPDYNLCKGAKGVPCAHDGYTPEDINNFVGIFSGFFNMFALVMLFVIYLMLEKDPNEKMFKGDSKAAGEIEHMIDHYISLKTILSFMTGLVVAIMLLICSIQLAVLFGIMSFVLNYIPNVGSVIDVPPASGGAARPGTGVLAKDRCLCRPWACPGLRRQRPRADCFRLIPQHDSAVHSLRAGHVVFGLGPARRDSLCAHARHPEDHVQLHQPPVRSVHSHAYP